MKSVFLLRDLAGELAVHGSGDAHRHELARLHLVVGGEVDPAAGTVRSSDILGLCQRGRCPEHGSVRHDGQAVAGFPSGSQGADEYHLAAGHSRGRAGEALPAPRRGTKRKPLTKKSIEHRSRAHALLLCRSFRPAVCPLYADICLSHKHYALSLLTCRS